MATMRMKPPLLPGSGSGFGVDGVVVILGVGRIDGDQRELCASPRAPPCVAGRARSASAMVAGLKTFGILWVWMAMRLTAFSLSKAPSRSRTRAEGRPSRPGAQHLDGDEIAVAGLALLAGQHVEFAAIDVFLVDRRDAPAAAGVRAENAEDLRARALQQLDDAPAIGGLARLGVRQRLDPQKGAVADAGRRRSRLLPCAGWRRRFSALAPAPDPSRPARRENRRRGRG